MEESKRKLAGFLKEASSWEWHRFLEAERDASYTVRESVVLSLIRSCAMEDLKSMKAALDRLDGREENVVRVVMPRVFFTYPYAERKAPEGPVETYVDGVQQNAVTVFEGTVKPENENVEAFQQNGKTVEIPLPEPEPMPSDSFKGALRRMSDAPRSLPAAVIACQEAWEAHFRGKGRMPDGSVKVSSVVAAKLLRMAQKGNLGAIEETFDRIDGKLADTVRIAGQDIRIRKLDAVAPAEAYLNEEGVWEAEAPALSAMWAEKLDPQGARIAAENAARYANK